MIYPEVTQECYLMEKMTIVFFFVFRSAITLKEFLDIIEIAFITEVNMRRSVVPSAVVSLVTMLCKII